MKKKLLFWGLILLLLMSTGILPVFAHESEEATKILFLMPYSRDLPAPDMLIEGVKEELEKTGDKIDYAYEYIDLGSFPNDEVYLSQVADFFKEKYTSRVLPDYIITMDALKPFIIEYGEEVFPGVKIMLTLNTIAEIDKTLSKDVISFIQVDGMAIKTNLSLIQDLFPERKDIYFILGDSEYERRILPHLESVEAENQTGLIFHYTNNLTYDELMEQMKSLSSDAVVYFIQWSLDADGKSFVPAEIAQEICETASVPVIGAGSQFLGLGVLGGYVYDFEVVGKNIGVTIASLIAGDEIPENLVSVSSNHYLFDWRQMEAYGISQEFLPEDRIILYQEENFWELYKLQIMVALALIFLQVIFIAILIKSISKEKKAEQELINLNRSLEYEVQIRTKDLEIANQKLSLINDELQVRSGEMEKLATTDRLTNISNRLKLDEIVKNEMARYKRSGSPFSLIMIDIDFFKKVNDDYGHQTGDLILKEVALLMKENIRRIDFIGRWGGEEFLIVCPDTASKGAIILAESLRRKISEKCFDDRFNITISLGVAEVDARDHDEMIVFKRADEALYQAKNKGRNCVCYDGECEFDFLNENYRE